MSAVRVLSRHSLRRVVSRVFRLDLTAYDSGDVFLAGEDVRVEWEAPQDSSYFDVFLLFDGAPVSLQLV